MSDENPAKPGRKPLARQAHWIEWVTGAVATAVVAGMISWIAYNAMTQTGGAPDLSVEIVRQRAFQGGYEISFIVANAGPRTAGSVPVLGEIRDGERLIEAREVTFDYVPAHSQASGSLLFQTDPARHTLSLRASGFVDP